MTHLALDFPPALWLGLPLAVAVLVVLARAQFGAAWRPGGSRRCRRYGGRRC